MGGVSKAFSGAIKKVTKFHDKIDPIGKKGREMVEDTLGVPRSSDIGDSLNPQEASSSGNLSTSVSSGPPTTDEARQLVDRDNTLRRRRGRASTILTGRTGDTSSVNVGTKTLLGA